MAAQIEDLLLWKLPTRSAVVLGAITAAFLVVQFVKINVIATAAWAALLAVLASFLYNNVSSILH